jgi:hypothetical protein
MNGNYLCVWSVTVGGTACCSDNLTMYSLLGAIKFMLHNFKIDKFLFWIFNIYQISCNVNMCTVHFSSSSHVVTSTSAVPSQ